MKTKETISTCSDIAILLMNALAWAGVYLFTDLFLYQKIIYTIGIIWIFLYAFILYFIRRFIKKRWMQNILFLLLFVPLVLYIRLDVNLLTEKAIFFSMFLIFSILGVKAFWKSGRKHDEYHIAWYYFVEIIIFYGYGVFRHAGKIKSFTILLTIGLIIFHFVNLYLKQLKAYFMEKENIETMPKGRMIGFSSGIALVIILGMLCCMFLSVLLQFDSVFSGVSQCVMWLLQGVASVLLHLFGWIADVNMPGKDLGMHGYMGSSSMTALKTKSEGRDLLAIVAIFGMCVMLVLCVYFIYRKIRARVMKKLQSTDEVVSLGSERSDVESAGTGLKAVYKKLFHTNAGKIRAHFKKRVKKSLSKTVSKSETAHDMCDKVNEKGEDDLSELTKWYDIARYSDQKISKQDIKGKM